MNDDVIQPNSGYILIEIDSGGYIKEKNKLGWGPIIHRETKALNISPSCFTSFSDIKEAFPFEDETAILELDSRGAGKAIWMREEQKELLDERLAIWKGCYGKWPIKILSFTK